MYLIRFGGRDNLVEPWYSVMDSVNIRLYYGGHFVTKNKKTTYERHPNVAPKDFGILLRFNVEEVCYFEFVYWITSDLGFSEAGEIWFRKKGCSLYNGRARIKGDEDIPLFLESPEKDGFYHLYIVHSHEKVVDGNVLAYGPGVTFYSDSENTSLGEGKMDDVVHLMDKAVWGGPLDASYFNTFFYNPTSQNNGSVAKNLPPFHPQSSSSTPQLPLNPEEPQQTPTAKPSQPLKKLPILPRQKQTPTAAVDSEQNRRVEDVSEDEEEHSAELDSDDSDVYLSEADFEDNDDDDLFNENVDNDISERVTRSLGGLTKKANTTVQELENDEEDENGVSTDDEEGEGLGNDVELVDSDDEAVSVVGSDDEATNFPEFNPVSDFKGNIILTKGLKFPSNVVFRKALRHHAIEKGYDYYYLHNNKSRISVYCSRRCDCPWKRARIVKCTCNSKSKCRFRIHCRKLKGEDTWQIKSLRLKHLKVCSWQNNNSKITSQNLAERYLEDWRVDPNWKLEFFIKRAERECKTKLGYHKAYYAKKRALKMIFGDSDKEYEKVWDYAAAIRKYNPGSTAVVKVTGVENQRPQFQRMYVCLKACKEGFIAGCRPILGVDGAHLKGGYPGILLTAVGKDGNNNIFPVAWAVVEIENAETWAWFLQLLREDLASVADAVTWVHEQDEVTMMSDRQKVC